MCVCVCADMFERVCDEVMHICVCGMFLIVDSC